MLVEVHSRGGRIGRLVDVGAVVHEALTVADLQWLAEHGWQANYLDLLLKFAARRDQAADDALRWAKREAELRSSGWSCRIAPDSARAYCKRHKIELPESA